MAVNYRPLTLSCKWRTNPTNIGPSRTFNKTDTFQNAIDQAIEAVQRADYLPDELRMEALRQLQSKTVRTYTPGLGPGAGSSGFGRIEEQ